MRVFVEVELIIWPRGAVRGKTQRPDASGRVGQPTLSAGDGASDVRGGLCVISCAGGGESESLWIGSRSPDVCGVAEKWENAIHLQPACAGELRECTLPALGNAALLVYAAPSGAADCYLEAAIPYTSIGASSLSHAFASAARDPRHPGLLIGKMPRCG